MASLIPLVIQFVKETGLRKLSFAFACEAAFCFLRFRSALGEDNFVTLSMVCMLGIFGSNVFEHQIKSKNGGKNVESSEITKPFKVPEPPTV